MSRSEALLAPLAVRLAPRAHAALPAAPLARVRLALLAVLQLTAALTLLPIALEAASPVWLRGAAALGVVLAAWRWQRMHASRPGGSLGGKVLEAAAILLAALAAGLDDVEPLLFAALLYRSLHRGLTLAVAGAGLWVAAFLLAGLLTPADGPGTLAHVLHMAPLLLVGATLTSALAIALERQERGGERERAVRAIVADFVGAQSTGRIDRIAVDGALALLGRPAGAAARLVPLADAGVAAPGRLVLPVAEASALVVEGPPEACAEAAEALGALAHEITLARASVAVRERRVEQQCQALVHSTADVVTVVDEAGMIRVQSPSSRLALGYGGDELIGQDLDALVHPDEQAMLHDLVAAAVHGVEAPLAVECRMRRADGGWLDVETVASDLREHPEVGGIVLASRNVTERKRIVRALQESRERLQVVIDNAGAIIFMLDDDARIVLASREAGRVLDRDAATIPGRRVRDLLPPHMAEHLERRVEAVRAAGVLRQFPERMYVDGEERHFLLTLVPLQGGGVCGIAADITEHVRSQEEKRELEHALHQSQRLEALGQMAGGVAHDFNNLLAVILTAAEFVRDELPGGHPATDDVEEIARAAHRGADLTRHLLIFSRREHSHREHVDVHAVMADTERLLRRTLKDDVVLETATADGPACVLADRGQLEQVLVNLVLNARDAGGRHVTVKSELVELEGRPYVHLAVTDDGDGMEEWVVRRAFEPFFTTKPKGSGTGLGLATVYGIVMGNEGQIALHSTPGKGTTVSIHLPLGDDEAREPAAAPLPPLVEETAGTVLLVEDEDALRALTRRILGKRGFTVIEAANPEEALAAFADADRRPDLLLTDVVMPGGSGRELCDRLREQAPELPTVFMSGYTDDVMERYGVDAPRDELLQKPFDAATLVGAVRRALGEE